MKPIKAGLLATLMAVPSLSSADMLGIYLGAGGFNAEFSGTFKTENTSNDIHVGSDLGLDTDTATYLYVAFEHPIPLLPNIKLARTELEQSASYKLKRDLNFKNKDFITGSAVESKVDLSHTDATLYYEILDNWVNLDLGITARLFDGELALEDGTQKASQKIDIPVPFLYGKAQFDLPFTGFYAAVDVNWIGYGGNIFMDTLTRLGYESSIGLGAEAGYRSINLEAEDTDNVEVDLEFSGFYVAATFHF